MCVKTENKMTHQRVGVERGGGGVVGDDNVSFGSHFKLSQDHTQRL